MLAGPALPLRRRALRPEPRPLDRRHVALEAENKQVWAEINLLRRRMAVAETAPS